MQYGCTKEPLKAPTQRTVWKQRNLVKYGFPVHGHERYSWWLIWNWFKPETSLLWHLSLNQTKSFPTNGGNFQRSDPVGRFHHPVRYRSNYVGLSEFCRKKFYRCVPYLPVGFLAIGNLPKHWSEPQRNFTRPTIPLMQSCLWCGFVRARGISTTLSIRFSEKLQLLMRHCGRCTMQKRNSLRTMRFTGLAGIIWN